jgi:hypothetical protein
MKQLPQWHSRSREFEPPYLHESTAVTRFRNWLRTYAGTLRERLGAAVGALLCVPVVQ